MECMKLKGYVHQMHDSLNYKGLMMDCKDCKWIVGM